MILLIFRVLAIALLVMALARPQSGKKFSEISSEGIDIFLVLDTSGSMKALDFQIAGNRVTRVDVVKKVVTDFIKKRPNDRMGLVVFAEEAFTQCPLTLDHGVLLKFVDSVYSGIAGDSTAIGSGIGTAVNRMKDIKAKSRVIILLTDGVNNTGEIPPLKAAEIAKTFNIKIYTIGVGTQGEAPIKVNTPFGERMVYGSFPLDEETLKKISQLTGGKFFRAMDTESLEKIYTEIDKLERTEVKVKEYTEYNELFIWFLIPGLLILLAELLLAQTRLRKIP